MSKRLEVGAEFTSEGFTFRVLGVASDSGGTQAVCKVTRFKAPDKPPPAAPAPGLAAQMLAESLDPLKGARHLGYLEGLQRAAEMAEHYAHISGRGVSVFIRNHAEDLKRGRVE